MKDQLLLEAWLLLGQVWVLERGWELVLVLLLELEQEPG